MSNRNIRYVKGKCEICGCTELIRGSSSNEKICTNCGNINISRVTRFADRTEIMGLLNRHGSLSFKRMLEMTNVSDDDLFITLEKMHETGLLNKMNSTYSMTKRGKRWYNDQRAKEYGY